MRSNTLDAARRAYLNLVRGTVHQVNDKPKMQTVDARLLHNELLTGIERMQEYGFSSVPPPPDPNGPKAAEVLVAFLHGNRSHPVIVATDDRRTRPTNWGSGDSGLWHHGGAYCKHTDAGWVHDQGSQKKPYTITVGNAVLTVADGKITAQVGGSTGPAVVVKADAVYLGGDPDNVTIFGKEDPTIRKATAIVNGDIVTDTDVDQRLNLVILANGGKVAGDERDRLRLQVLRNLIDETLEIQEAKANDITIDSSQIDQTFQRVAGQFKQTPASFSRATARPPPRCGARSRASSPGSGCSAARSSRSSTSATRRCGR